MMPIPELETFDCLFYNMLKYQCEFNFPKINRNEVIARDYYDGIDDAFMKARIYVNKIVERYPNRLQTTSIDSVFRKLERNIIDLKGAFPAQTDGMYDPRLDEIRANLQEFIIIKREIIALLSGTIMANDAGNSGISGIRVPRPLLTQSDVSRVRSSLHKLLEVWGHEPVREDELSEPWDAFRAAFCHHDLAVSQIPYSVDSNGLPDINGLPQLIRESTAISPEARDALEEFVAEQGGNLHACMLKSNETIVDYRTRMQLQQPDNKHILTIRKKIRAAFTALGNGS